MNRATMIAGIGGGLLAVGVLAPMTGTALGDLAKARAQQGAAATRAAIPDAPEPPLLGTDLRMPGANGPRAAAAGIARVKAWAASGGVLVEQAEPVSTESGLVRWRVRLSGANKAVIALVDRIERERPLQRLARWQATALPEGGLRFEGEMVAAWR